MAGPLEPPFPQGGGNLVSCAILGLTWRRIIVVLSAESLRSVQNSLNDALCGNRVVVQSTAAISASEHLSPTANRCPDTPRVAGSLY